MTTAEELLDFQQLVRMVPIGETVATYVVNLVRATRHKNENAPDFVKKYVNYGGSIRAAQFIVLAAKARALSRKRYHVTYDDITSLAIPVLRHRILLNFHAESERIDTDEILTRLIERMCRAPKESLMLQRFLDPGVLAGISSSICWPRQWWTASSPVCIARRISASARSSPSTAPTRPETICATWIGICLPAPSAAT